MQVHPQRAKRDRFRKMTGNVGRSEVIIDLRPTYEADDPLDGAKCRDLLPGDDLNLFFQPGPEDRPEGITNVEWSAILRGLGAERDMTAKVRYCDECPVRGKCLEIGYFEPHGVFGGTTPSDREYLRKGQRVPIDRVPQTPSRKTLRVVALVKEGYSFDDVVAEMGISRRQVSDLLRGYLGSRHAQ